MAKFRKKPVVVEAIQWTGKNSDEITAFVGSRARIVDNYWLYIKTPEGEVEAIPGYSVIKGVAGEFYPCRPDIFEQTYEAVD